jgi:hypothetical protein
MQHTLCENLQAGLSASQIHQWASSPDWMRCWASTTLTWCVRRRMKALFNSCQGCFFLRILLFFLPLLLLLRFHNIDLVRALADSMRIIA